MDMKLFVLCGQWSLKTTNKTFVSILLLNFAMGPLLLQLCVVNISFSCNKSFTVGWDWQNQNHRLVIKSAASGAYQQGISIAHGSMAQSKGHNGGWLTGKTRETEDKTRRRGWVGRVETAADRMRFKITLCRRILAKGETKGEQCCIITEYYLIPVFPNSIYVSWALLLIPPTFSLSAGCLHAKLTTSSCRGRSSSWRRPTRESANEQENAGFHPDPATLH